MKRKNLKMFIVIGVLLAVTCVAMAWAKTAGPFAGPAANVQTVSNKSGVIGLEGKLSQDKIFVGGDGSFSLSLTMRADEIFSHEASDEHNVDMVIVLDRSGSMGGDSIEYARQAILDLIANLSDKDRFALVSYSDGVISHSDLVYATSHNRESLSHIAGQIQAGGGTNLGAGLREGIELLNRAERVGNMSKIILISDGLANQGVTDPTTLGEMASRAIQGEFSVSTVGVGLEYNEYLLTMLADRGAGTYHFMENPATFAEVFLNEFHTMRSVAATSLSINVPQDSGVALVNAAGFPIDNVNGEAVFYPGDLLSGQSRTLHLTFRVPAAEAAAFTLKGIHLDYTYENERYSVALEKPFEVACVADESLAYASIDKATWEKKVLQDDYNTLKEEVASDIKAGNKGQALERIADYEQRQSEANEYVNSPAVAQNIDQDLGELRDSVEDTFTGSEAEVQHKQKANSKSIQQEGYQARRDK